MQIRTYGYLGSAPLYLRQKETFYWFITDRLGIPQKLITETGRVVWAAEYDSYGNCIVVKDDIENPIRLPGQYLDTETGLYYNLHRYYDPRIGRYLQVDPAGDGLNLYAYVGGNPVNAIDPQGLCAARMVGGGADIWAGAALIGGALSGPVGWGAIGAGVVGALMVANGADNLIAGGRTAISGEYTRSFGEAAIHRYVQDDLTADLLYMGTQLGLGYAGIRADRALRAAQMTGDVVGGITDAGLVVDEYGSLSQNTTIPGQAHHLNQNAAFKRVIPRNSGMSIKLEGNAFTQIGSPHYNAHASLENFWNLFRRGGARFRQRPTNLEYSRALLDSLQAGGLSRQQAFTAVRASIRQRIRYGLLGGLEIPNVPRRMPQVH